MLMRAGSDRPFPDNDLSYIAFVVTAYFNLTQVDAVYDPEQPRSLREEAHWFLDVVPLLSHLPGSIQTCVLHLPGRTRSVEKSLAVPSLNLLVFPSACFPGQQPCCHVVVARYSSNQAHCTSRPASAAPP